MSRSVTPAPSSKLFTTTANAHLTRLQAQHVALLSSADPGGLVEVVRYAHAVRHAVFIYHAITDILRTASSTKSASASASSSSFRLPSPLPDGQRMTNTTRTYLSSMLPRMEAALTTSDFPLLARLSGCAQQVLDSLVVGYEASFRHVDPLSMAVLHAPSATRDGTLDADDEILGFDEKRGTAVRSRRFCWVPASSLTRRDKCIFALYILTVIASVVAMTMVTVDFAHEYSSPRGSIRSNVSEQLVTPVVTVCLSQTGVPFSRLQLFNYTDAEGRNFVGADPMGPQFERVSPAFENVVDRFWDNPDRENCNATVGDFYPFPVSSLNRIVNGSLSTRCRQCYRVGVKQSALASSLAFQHSSVLSFYTDSFLLQCMKSVNGLSGDSLSFCHDQIFDMRKEMDTYGVLELDSEGGAGEDIPSVAELSEEGFRSITSEQACNILYFSFFPKALNREDKSVDIRYSYNGSAWKESGTGEYFRVRELKFTGIPPTESLQMFIETNNTVGLNQSVDDGNRDVILIGPNTQTYTTFRRAIVFGQDRYDITSSTSNLRQSDIIPLYGYWLVYNIYYNFNRFVTDEWYKETTYPFSQWFVDVTGYASLFTGASLFSLLLLPLLRTMRRRYKARLLQQTPEAYIWAKYRRQLSEQVMSPQRREDLAFLSGPGPGAGSDVDDLLRKSNSVMLPGYNL